MIQKFIRKGEEFMQEDQFMEKLFLEYKPEKDNLIPMLDEIQEYYRICTKGGTKRII